MIRHLSDAQLGWAIALFLIGLSSTVAFMRL